VEVRLTCRRSRTGYNALSRTRRLAEAGVATAAASARAQLPATREGTEGQAAARAEEAWRPGRGRTTCRGFAGAPLLIALTLAGGSRPLRGHPPDPAASAVTGRGAPLTCLLHRRPAPLLPRVPRLLQSELARTTGRRSPGMARGGERRAALLTPLSVARTGGKAVPAHRRQRAAILPLTAAGAAFLVRLATPPGTGALPRGCTRRRRRGTLSRCRSLPTAVRMAAGATTASHRRRRQLLASIESGAGARRRRTATPSGSRSGRTAATSTGMTDAARRSSSSSSSTRATATTASTRGLRPLLRRSTTTA